MRYKLLALIVLVIFVFSCAPKEAAVPTASPFIGGTTGLVMSFQDLRPEVFDGGADPFDVVIKLENKGEAFVARQDARVKLSGINPVEFGKREADLIITPPDDLIEVRKDPQGTILPAIPIFAEFLSLNHLAPIVGAEARFPLRADVCYTYKTTAVSKLCVLSDILNPPLGAICEVNEAKTVFNSGSPVQISNFKESARARDKIGFTFDVLNGGVGEIFERNSRCDRVQRQRANRVFLTIETNLPGLTCTGLETTTTGAQGFTTLYSGIKTVSCTQPVTGRADFEQMVRIEAVFDIEESTTTEIVVKSSGIQ